MRVAICICTFRRRGLLRELLKGIAQLAFHKVRTPEIQIVVVDNDERGSAEEVCRATSLPWPLQYVVEPRRGITHARNRAVSEAGSVDFITFIDDDEVPSAEWLDELLWTQAESAADVVSGPVFPQYASEIADWVKKGGFFEPKVLATGTEREVCACNNVLIGSHVFKQVSGFDDAFALSGAEDTNFFLRVRKTGHKIVWSQQAVVCEAISAQRGTVSWILRREYQTGNGWVFCEAAENPGLSNRMVRSLKACGHVFLGSAKAICWLVFLNKAAVVRALQKVSLGSGMLAALIGHRFLAYKNAGAEPVRQLEMDNRALRTPS